MSYDHIDEVRAWSEYQFSKCEHEWQQHFEMHRYSGGEYGIVTQFCTKCAAFEHIAMGYRVVHKHNMNDLIPEALWDTL